MPQLTVKSLTTEYVSNEDRICLKCILEDNSNTIIWLTQRLSNRLVKALLQPFQKELEKLAISETTPKNNHIRSNQKKLPPSDNILTKTRYTDNWLLETVTISRIKDKLHLIFKNSNHQEVNLILSASQLHQWLDILCETYKASEWSINIWPKWLGFTYSEQELTKAVWN